MMFPPFPLLAPPYWLLLGVTLVLLFTGTRLWFEDLKPDMNGCKWAWIASYGFSLVVTMVGAFPLISETDHGPGCYLLGIIGLALVVAGGVLIRIVLLLRSRDN